jgi:hypothetical protein
MPIFTTPLLVREVGNIPASVDESKITPHINAAVVEIKRLITPELYNQILNYNNPGVEDDNQDKFIDLQTAETNLALGYFIPSLNMQLAGENGGILKGKGWDMTRIDFYSLKELKILSDNYKNVAYSIIKKYIPGDAASDFDEINFSLPGSFNLTSI